MLDKLKEKLIEDCRYWYKQWSAWLAVLWGTLVTMFFVNPSSFQDLVNLLPEETRAKLSPLVLFLASAIPIIVRNMKQANLPSRGGDASRGQETGSA